MACAKICSNPMTRNGISAKICLDICFLNITCNWMISRRIIQFYLLLQYNLCHVQYNLISSQISMTSPSPRLSISWSWQKVASMLMESDHLTGLIHHAVSGTELGLTLLPATWHFAEIHILYIVRYCFYIYHGQQNTYIKHPKACLSIRFPLDKMAAISQTFSNASSLMKCFDSNVTGVFFLRVQLTLSQHWFWYWLGAEQSTSH